MVKRRFAARLLSCVSFVALSTAPAMAHGGGCLELQAPTTINTNKKCVRVEKTIAGDVVNNATIGKDKDGEERHKPGFFIGDDGLIDGRLVNNGTIVGGRYGSGALTLGEAADVTDGIFNNGTISSALGSGISLGTVEYDEDELEIEAAALTGDIVNAGSINGKDFGIVARYGTMAGGLVNEADGEINGGLAGVYVEDAFTSWTGGIHNSGVIAGGFAGILIGDWGLPAGEYGGEGGEGDDDEDDEGGEGGEGYASYVPPQSLGVVFSGGIFNGDGGTIISSYGPSIGVGGASFGGGVHNDGLITQDLGEEGEGYSQLVSPYRGVGVVFAAGTVEGGLTNGSTGSIYGLAGPAVWITEATQSFAGGIANEGLISGASDGIRILSGTFGGGLVNGGSGQILAADGDGVSAATVWSGGVLNDGLISGARSGFVFVGPTFAGDFVNNGTIAGESGDGVSIEVGSWGDDDTVASIVNASGGDIEGGSTGFELDADTLIASVRNDGAISGGVNGVVFEVDDFNAPVENNGTIEGGSNGLVMVLAQASGGFENTGEIAGESGDGVSITVGEWGSAEERADIVNASSGIISGGETGFSLDATTVYGDFLNDGTISGDGEDTGVHLAADLFVGDVTNNGDVESVRNALRLNFDTFDGSFSNTGTIAGGSNGAIVSAGSISGDFTNSGTISGESGTGASIVVGDWGSSEDVASILNVVDAKIIGGETGFALVGQTVFASIKNEGTISGGTDGFVMLVTGANGGFTNTGEIVGEAGAGVSITAGDWGSADVRADILNALGGTITGGETGFYLSATNFYGDFINDGTITGGGSETGTHLIADVFNGDVINTGLTQAASNALHLEFGTLNGEVRNTGTIEATDAAGTAVLLQIGNGATFTNADGGLILGDAVLAGDAAYAFIGEDGGIDGSLVGEGGDDTIAVRGTHHFIGGTASDFASFTVEDGGTALMGARSEGGSSAGGYSFANVEQLTVQDGGVLYIDRSAVLEVGSYNQEAAGVLEFFLGAPSGFSGLTGDVAAGAGDYGRLVVRGEATLDGTVVGFLDPLFGNANPNLRSVRYEDVIVADGGINGDFTSVALIADSSLFELNSDVDGNTIDVTVVRTSLGDISDVPGIIVTLGGPFDAMVSDRSNGVGSSSCGLAGDGWCLNRFAQNDATQVMTDASPEDPFDWLRTGTRNPGELATWGRAIGGWGESDGWNGSKGSKFALKGAIVGVDYVFDRDLMAGVAAQWTTTDVDFKRRPDNADVENFEFGAYASIGDARLYLNANASAIWHNVKVRRFTHGGGQAQGAYDGRTLSIFAEGGKIFETEEGLRIGPFLSLSLTHLETDPYRERGTGPLLFVRRAELDSLKSATGVRLGYPIGLPSGRKVVPEFRLAWAHEFMDDQASFRASVQGQNVPPSVIFGEKFARDTVQLGAGVTVPLSGSTNLYVDYDAGLNPDITTHTVSAGLRVTW